MKKIFDLQQKLTLMVNEYRVLEDAPGGSQKLTAYARQKRLAMREKFTLFSDEAQKEALAISSARSIMDFGAIYDIKDASGKPLAAVKKEFTKSLINSNWSIYNPDGKSILFTVYEKSQGLAIFRRVWDFIPFVGDIPFPIKYHFLIKSGDKVAGEYVKTSLWWDYYALYLEPEFEKTIDKKAWMIIAVLLDAMQGR